MRLKTLFLTLTLGAIAFLTNAEKTAEGQPGISFTQTTHDFGVIPENGGSVTTTFEFTNPGDGPLLILNASASCGCTRPEYPRKPVKPGKKDKITVTYNPKGRPGEFTKNVTVRTNVKGKKKVVLKIKGNVTPASN
ncbi:MAG: DUF1573 domain-containing protein [Muribaculaceae bacterium]|jgi:hypothetical protein